MWLNAYIDRNGHYWTATYGGMGNVSFNRIKSDHAFVVYIEKLIGEGSVTKEQFQHEYYEQTELARLLPNMNAKTLDKAFDDNHNDVLDEFDLSSTRRPNQD